MQLDSHMYKILSNKLNFASVIAAVADCELFTDRKGAAAWTRVQDMYDPQGLTTVVNRCITLMSTFQNGADAKTHVAAMDRVTAEAMRSFTLPNGAYDYAKFGKVMLAVIYHVSFDDTTRDELRHGMRNRDLSTYTVQHIRLTALEVPEQANTGEGRNGRTKCIPDWGTRTPGVKSPPRSRRLQQRASMCVHVRARAHACAACRRRC